jgi:hypothetical protein
MVGIINLLHSAEDALQQASAALIMTQWLEFRRLTADTFVTAMEHARVFDPSRHLSPELAADPRIRYFCIGRGNEINR